jgi:hypothetical protein
MHDTQIATLTAHRAIDQRERRLAGTAKVDHLAIALDPPLPVRSVPELKPNVVPILGDHA